MNVFIAAVDDLTCPAARALTTEGVFFTVLRMRYDLDYGRALAAIWAQGEEFCLIEHDIVPWPGALEAIAGCEEPWCVYDYPFHPGRIGNALGCLRVSKDVVREFPDLSKEWVSVDWKELEGVVRKAISTASGRRKPHRHSPPLAHLRTM